MSEPSFTADEVLANLQKSSEIPKDELKALADYFVPNSSDQAKAYLALSLLCQNTRKGTHGVQAASSTATEKLVRTLEPVILEDLGETDDTSLIRGISFLKAIFHVDAEVATTILTKDGTLEDIMDTADISKSPALELAVAHLLAEASGHKKCRAILSPAARQWLDIQSRQSKDSKLAAACGVARVKLWQGTFVDATDGEEIESPPQTTVDELATLMKGIVVSDNAGDGIVEAVEGLAYLSTDPELKEKLSKDPAFLKSLFALIPTRKSAKALSSDLGPRVNSPLLYGIVTVITNLIGYRPRLSEEQQHMQKLKNMSKVAQSKPGKAESPLDDDGHVKVRARRLIEAGLLPSLSVLPSLTDSQAVHKNVGRAFLSITEDKDHRGLVLQAGGAKALQNVIRHLSSQPTQADKDSAITDPAPLEAIQALAKLSITSSPLHVYGADVGPIYDALRPLSLLVIHTSATQLQQFEGMMALTNIASISPDFASRIANQDGLLSRVELLLFEEHTLLRRASMELICNLVSGSDMVFQKYAGDGTTTSGVKSKLQLVLAICDVEDLPTRLAASGTLAILMNSTSACKLLLELQLEKGRFIPIMTELLQPTSSGEDVADKHEDAGLIHRATICILNLLTQNEMAKVKEVGSKYEGDVISLRTKLMDLVKRREAIPLPDQILQVVVQALKVMATLSK